MCGICGAIGIQDGAGGETLVRRMMNAMRHRGPDDEGIVVAPPVCLGMRRLSIIDLPGGGQPVFNERRDLAVVFNGEIYNFEKLRRSLEACGHWFHTRSDTEAIVHAYEEWGADCVHHLRGMFAFAIVELSKGEPARGRRVFLARDRLGIKPLYYATVDGALLFASELKSLLACGRIPRTLSVSAVEGFLLFGSAGEPTTLVEGVSSLPPAHRMQIEIARLEPRPERYWEPRFSSGSGANGNGHNRHDRPLAARQVRSMLEESVRLHLIADVPLGIFLSSGIDSTALAALASRERSNLLTFTVVFPEREYSETEIARRTARTLGTRHQEVALSGKDMLDRLDAALSALDQPSMDGVNTFLVSGAARQAGLKVALSGLGGDEVFGGYSTFRSTPRLVRLAAVARVLPAGFRAAAAATIVRVGERRRPADAVHKLAALVRNPHGLPHPYFFARALFTPRQMSALRSGAKDCDSSAPWRSWLAEAAETVEGLNTFSAVSGLEMRSYMVNTLLRDTDAVSMAHGLEVRVPFLDHPLIELVGQLPRWSRGTRPKGLLVEALKDLLPHEVVHQKKRTFTLPWECWLRGPLRKRVEAGLGTLAPSLEPVLNGEAVRSLWLAFLAGRTSWSRPWSLYVLNDWTRRQLDAPLGCLIQ